MPGRSFDAAGGESSPFSSAAPRGASRSTGGASHPDAAAAFLQQIVPAGVKEGGGEDEGQGVETQGLFGRGK